MKQIAEDKTLSSAPAEAFSKHYWKRKSRKRKLHFGCDLSTWRGCQHAWKLSGPSVQISCQNMRHNELPPSTFISLVLDKFICWGWLLNSSNRTFLSKHFICFCKVHNSCKPIFASKWTGENEESWWKGSQVLFNLFDKLLNL